MSADDKPKRDAKGRILPGQGSLNAGGRPKALAEYQQWLRENALEKAKTALLGLLDDPDGKVRVVAIKEINDRLFGRAAMAITDPDGKPVSFGLVFLPTRKDEEPPPDEGEPDGDE